MRQQEDTGMSEKSKRKNDEPIPRRYWWIFGILAILLLIPFRTPENFVYILTGYVVMFFVVGNITVEFLRNYGSRYHIVILMLACLMMPFAQLWFITQHEPMLFVECESKQEGVLAVANCIEECWTNMDAARYITVFRLPVSLLIQPIRDKDSHPGCLR
jgi:hypothetical protein